MLKVKERAGNIIMTGENEKLRLVGGKCGFYWHICHTVKSNSMHARAKKTPRQVDEDKLKLSICS